jgi:hypothetical protein
MILSRYWLGKERPIQRNDSRGLVALRIQSGFTLAYGTDGCSESEPAALIERRVAVTMRLLTADQNVKRAIRVPLRGERYAPVACAGAA